MPIGDDVTDVADMCCLSCEWSLRSGDVCIVSAIRHSRRPWSLLEAATEDGRSAA